MLRPGRVRLVLLVLFLAGVAVTACASKCLQVQQVLCLCQGQTQFEQTNCQDNASTQENLAPPTKAQLDVCAQLLPGCNDLIDGGSIVGCDALKTDEGKRICGLSR
jgi:hypothetical protein